MPCAARMCFSNFHSFPKRLFDLSLTFNSIYFSSHHLDLRAQESKGRLFKGDKGR